MSVRDMIKRGTIVGADGSFRVITSNNGYIMCRTFIAPSTVIRGISLLIGLVEGGVYLMYDSDGELYGHSEKKITTD